MFFYDATKLCEDVPCCSHSLDLVATVDFKKDLSSIHPLSFNINHEETFIKLQKLWNFSNRGILAYEINLWSDIVSPEVTSPRGSTLHPSKTTRRPRFINNGI